MSGSRGGFGRSAPLPQPKEHSHGAIQPRADPAVSALAIPHPACDHPDMLSFPEAAELADEVRRLFDDLQQAHDATPGGLYAPLMDVIERDDALEVVSHTLFIPVFFITAGFLVDFKLFFFTLRDQPLLVVGVLGALFGGKWLAAETAGRLFGYGSRERSLMFGLTLPQVAATLAVALVAYATKNAAGERLIDRPMLNATVVLVIVSSILGLILTERAAKKVTSPPTVAPSAAAS